MARSSVDRLSPALRRRLHELLDDPRITQQQIADAVNATAGQRVVSKSAVNRYAVRMREVGERNRQATEAIKAYLEHSGAEGQQDLSEALVYQLRVIALDMIDLMRGLHDRAEDDEADPAETADRIGRLLSQAARSLRDIELSADRSAERRRRLAADVEAAAEDVSRAARQGGITEEQAAALRTRVLDIVEQ